MVISDSLEWEVIDSGGIHSVRFANGVDFLKNARIELYRNDEFGIEGLLTGEFVVAESPMQPRRPGKRFTKGEKITGYSADGMWIYEMSGSCILTYDVAHLPNELPFPLFKGTLCFDRIERRYIGNGSQHELTTVQEWYVSGSVQILFPGLTHRSYDGNVFVRSREGLDPKEDFSPGKDWSGSRDYMFIQLSGMGFIVSKVPRKLGPVWAQCWNIEYRGSFGRIPDERERGVIASFLGFIFGTQLNKIGESGYDRNGRMIWQIYENPSPDSVVRRCREPSMPPVKIQKAAFRHRAHRIIEELLPAFLERYHPLQLGDVLSKYWVARYSQLGVNLPVLSSALETLAMSALKANKDHKHCYIDPVEFRSLIADEIASIQSKLPDGPHRDKILNKIRSASLMGSNEKLSILFTMLGIGIGEIEKKAIRERNKMAHSSPGNYSDKKIEAVILLTRAYETLVNRVLLGLLGYRGSCVDYYTEGFPERNIHEPIPSD